MGEGSKRNLPCHCGSNKKYKNCCWGKDQKQEIIKQVQKEQPPKRTARFFISGPYKKCPNPKCLRDNSFGVTVIIEGAKSYMRECVECGHRVGYDLPEIKKKILYLDQFVISNLIKLLDKSHKSHQRIKGDPFWEELFVKLEKASRTQAIVCPDSFYHRDESLISSIDYRLMRRLYEHFSSGKTLYPSTLIEKFQISQHFESWIDGQKALFQFNPEDIAFNKNLHDWSVGLRISVGGKPYPGQLEDLQTSNTKVKGQLGEVWKRWQNEKNVSFVDRVKEETLGLGAGLRTAYQQFLQRRVNAMIKMAQGEKYEMQLDDFMPPMSNDIIDAMVSTIKRKNIPQDQIPTTINRYFNDVNSLLEVPSVRISSVMLAGLAHMAKNGKKNPPKSTYDVQFISSYLPYCDAMFVDKESFLTLTKFPKNTPANLRLTEFPAKLFCLNNKDEFLKYLDKLVGDIPDEQINILKDINGENYANPFWDIIEREKIDLAKKEEA